MPFPIVFRRSAENVTANYDFTDIAEGTGIVRFYGGGTQISGSKIYRIDRQTFWTSVTSPAEDTGNGDKEKWATVSTTGSSFSKVIDLDFDSSTFNLPRTLRGSALACIPAYTIATNADTTGEVYAIVRYVRVKSDDSEVTIAESSSNIVALNENVNKQLLNDYFSIPCTIPLTIIKKGEKLRVTTEVWLRRVGGTSAQVVAISFDPQNLATPFSSAGYTQMFFQIPFKLEL